MSDPVPRAGANQAEPADPAQTPMGEFLVGIFRSFVGYAVLFACVLLIVKKPPFTFTVVDVVFFVTLLLTAVANARAARRELGGSAGTRSFWLHLVVALPLWLGAQTIHGLT